MEVPTNVYEIVIVSHGPNVRSEAIAQWEMEMSPCRGPGPRSRDTQFKRKCLGGDVKVEDADDPRSPFVFVRQSRC